MYWLKMHLAGSKIKLTVASICNGFFFLFTRTQNSCIFLLYLLWSVAFVLMVTRWLLHLKALLSCLGRKKKTRDKEQRTKPSSETLSFLLRKDNFLL